MITSFRLAAVMLALLGSMRSTSTHAQAFTPNSTTFSAGIGTLLSTLKTYGVTSESAMGPYHFKVEKGVGKHFSLGLSTNLMRNTWTVAPAPIVNSESTNTNRFMENSEVQRWAYSAVARLNMHVGNSKKFDPYFGAGLGYRSSNWSPAAIITDFEGINHVIASTPIMYEFGVGARYYLLPSLGVYAEIGSGKSLQGGFIFNIPGKGNKKGSGSGVGTGNHGNSNTGGTTPGKNKSNKMK